MKKPALVNIQIQPKGKISQLCLERGMRYLQDVITHLRDLPYGRISDKRRPELVLHEGRGTCTAKHALLVQLAFENNIRGMRLALCTYNMTETSHPEVKSVLRYYGLTSIPEARCFIQINNSIYNLVGKRNAFHPEIITEIEIAPVQIATFKKRYHKNYIENWLQIERMHKRWSPDQIWSIREECIDAAEENWESCPQLLCCA